MKCGEKYNYRTGAFSSEIRTYLGGEVRKKAGMEYSYLNQGGFDATNCSLSGMDPGPGLPSCNLPGSYGDLGRCSAASQMSSQAAAAYGTYTSMRAGPFNPAAAAMGTAAAAGMGGCPTPTSCSMMPRPPRDHHPQPPMFHTGM